MCKSLQITAQEIIRLNFTNCMSSADYSGLLKVVILNNNYLSSF